jgi:hypothetical protein
MEEAKDTPSRWEVSPWSGGCGYRKGFYVVRTVGGNNEWMKDGQGRARRFTTEKTALAAIAKATGQ